MKRHDINLIVAILLIGTIPEISQSGTTKGIVESRSAQRLTRFEMSRAPAHSTLSTTLAPNLPLLSTFDAASCIENRTAPPIGPYHWPANKQVAVYFWRHMFTLEQRQAILEAMAIWTLASETGSGVTFVDAGATDLGMNCSGCLTVGRKDIYNHDKHHYAFFHPMQEEEGLLVSAWIDLDFGVTNARALKGFMVHELGHGMGLWDCVTCGQKKTIMNRFRGMNKDNGLIAPSACDLVTVRNIYQQERQFARTHTSLSTANFARE